MKNKKMNLLLLVFLFSMSFNIFAEGKDNNDSVIIHFKPGKLEVSDKNLDTLLNKLNKSKKYMIRGYSCKEDKGSNAERLAGAARRAETVSRILIDHGFPEKNITTIAYDESAECKAVIETSER